MFFRFDHPENLFLLFLALPILFLGIRHLSSLSPFRRWMILCLRLLVLFLLVFSLAGLELVRSHSDLTVVALLDQSESVLRFFQPPASSSTSSSPAPSPDHWQKQFLLQASSLPTRKPDDRLALVTYDAKPTVHSLPSSSTVFDSGTIPSPSPGTDTASAIRTALALYPADSAKRMLLFWDGIDTSSPNPNSLSPDLLAAARQAKASGIPIDVVPLNYQLSRETLVESIHCPPHAQKGQSISVRILLSSTHPASGRLFLNADDQPIDLSPNLPGPFLPISSQQWILQSPPPSSQPNSDSSSQSSSSSRYLLLHTVNLPLQNTGITHFQATFEPDSNQDQISINNSAQAFTFVHGQSQILLVDGVGSSPGRILPDTLNQHNINTVILPPASFPQNLHELLSYDAVIFQNVPAEALSTHQQEFLAQYINNFAGGFLMIGGPDSFGAGGWTNTPIDRILPVNCQIPAQTILPSGALVIVMDRSGSMASAVANSPLSQQQVANEAAVQAVATLYPQDRIGVVAFDTQTWWVVGDVDQLSNADNPLRIASQIRSINPGGGTDIYPGLEQAVSALSKLGTQDAAVKHIILLTDGQSQDGPYYQLLARMAKANISLSTVGVGDSVNSTLLQQLAQMGGGTYYPVQNPSKLPQIFIKEARTIRRNLIKEKPFIPTRLQSGSPILNNLPPSPPLQGLVLTGFKSDPRIYTPLLAPDGEPLFAHWQVGLGRSAAFTSDALNRWASAWLSSPIYADFWPRTLRLISRPPASRAFDVTTTLQNNRLLIRLDAANASPISNNKSSPFINLLKIAGTALTPDQQSVPIQLTQTAPGIYETSIPASQTGNYIVSLMAQADNAPPQSIITGTSMPPGPELRTFQSNPALVQQIAQITGGNVLNPLQPQSANLFNRTSVSESRSLRPLWKNLLLCLVFLFLLDVASRRILFDTTKIKKAVLQRLDTFLGTLTPKPVTADATLASLKTKSKSSISVSSDSSSASTLSTADVASPPSDRKYQASPDDVIDENFSLTPDLPAEDSQSKPTSPSSSDASTSSSEIPTTSRLLDAKRRAARKHQE